MNAYEIADELDGRLDHKAANMLRQQADRIAKLEKQLNLHKNAHHRAVEIVQEKEDWIYKTGLDLQKQADRIAELEKCIEFGYKDAMDIVVLNNLGAEDNHWFVWAKKLVDINYTAPQPIEKPPQTNAEPVAWWYATEYADADMEGGHVEEFDFNQPSKYNFEGLIWEKPLYTTPQTKPLSDEEIRQCILDYFESDHYKRFPLPTVSIQFARAIEERHGIK